MLLALITMSWKSCSWKMSRYSSSLVIMMARKWPFLSSPNTPPNSLSRFCLSFRSTMLPSLTPMRMGILRALHAWMTSITCSRSLMLPGFRRILWTPASIASSARWKWKWTSATIGTDTCGMISLSAAVSFFSGTATRTRSAPAAARRWISPTHLSISYVYPAVIDWTLTRASPPMPTNPCFSSPTITFRVGRRTIMLLLQGKDELGWIVRGRGGKATDPRAALRTGGAAGCEPRSREGAKVGRSGSTPPTGAGTGGVPQPAPASSCLRLFEPSRFTSAASPRHPTHGRPPRWALPAGHATTPP